MILFEIDQFYIIFVVLIKVLFMDTKIGRKVQSGGCAIHCQDCSISQLCIPFTLNEQELDQLDNIIERKKTNTKVASAV